MNDEIINKFENVNPDNWPGYFVKTFSGKHLYTVTSLRALRPPVKGHSDGPLSKHAEAVAMMRVHYTMKKFTEKDVCDWLKAKFGCKFRHHQLQKFLLGFVV